MRSAPERTSSRSSPARRGPARGASARRRPRNQRSAAFHPRGVMFVMPAGCTMQPRQVGLGRAPLMTIDARPRVVILGGGFAGIGAAHKLKDADADVVLVDRHDYHTFQPLLYQFATGLLDESGVGHSIRDLVHDQDNVTVHKTPVRAIDFGARTVQLDGMQPLAYDYLVLGLGAQVNFFGTDGAAEHAFPMYTLADALRLKEHVLERWEAADKDPSLIDDGALNIVSSAAG